MSSTVNTVLGPVAADELGVVSVHEALLSVLPGAQYAYDIVIDRAEIFEILATKLTEFKKAGGGTIVDSTGMFQGRDLALYEALSRATGVHLVASTGQGPEAMLGGYFLTPQTNPPTPWPAEKFADLFGKEVTEGMVVPRVERRGAAGLVATAVTSTGMTPTDESLLRGAARAAAATGVPMLFRAGSDAVAELQVALDEGLPAARVAVSGRTPREVAERGAFAIVRDPETAAALVGEGLAERVLLTNDAIGVAKGHAADESARAEVPYSRLLTEVVPDLKARGVSDADIHVLLVENPRHLLEVR